MKKAFDPCFVILYGILTVINLLQEQPFTSKSDKKVTGVSLRTAYTTKVIPKTFQQNFQQYSENY